MYYVYMLRCEKNFLYTGITTDVARRFNEHITSVGAKYTKSHKPKNIEFVCTASNRVEASKIEYKIKHLTKQSKEELIKSCLNLFYIL